VYPQLVRALLFVLLLCGRAGADLPAPIVVKAAGTAAHGDDEWKVAATTDGMWCQQAVSPADVYTITLAAPTAIATVVITADNSVTGAEVVADGTSFKGALVEDKIGPTSTGHGTITARLGGGAVVTLVVKLTGHDHACVSGIDLGGRTVYGSDAATLWSDVRAAKAALTSCNAKQLAAAFVFPVEATTPTMDNDGMKEKTLKWTTASKLASGCKDKRLRGWNDTMKLADPVVESRSATTLDVHEGAVWSLELVDAHWKVRSFREG
jgi:hypothetical protein